MYMSGNGTLNDVKNEVSPPVASHSADKTWLTPYSISRLLNALTVRMAAEEVLLHETLTRDAFIQLSS